MAQNAQDTTASTRQPTQTRETRSFGSGHDRNENAFVVVWCVLFLTVIMGMAGFSVDLGNWYLHIQRAQRAADAAALDGDPYLPGNVATAREQARLGLIRNGIPTADAAQAFANSTCGATSAYCIAQVPGHPTQLEVRVTTKVTNTFLKVLGAQATNTFTRKAIADHRSGIQIGNGRNALGGSEPVTPAYPARWAVEDPNNGQYWVQVAGSDSGKQNGDQTLTSFCEPLHMPSAPYPIYGSPTVPSCTTSNPEYTSNGRFYRIHVDSEATAGLKYLVIQVYDPGYYQTVESSMNCAPALTVGVPRLGDEDCPGDAPSDGSVGTSFTTTYALHPKVTDPTNLSSCSAYPGTLNAGASMGDPSIGPYVHEWATVCTPLLIDVTKGGDYYLQVRTGAGNGQNEFALRAGLSTTPSPAAVDIGLSRQLVTISADTDLAVNYAFPPSGAPATFALAQVSNQWAGQPITFEFFDIGDSGSLMGAGILSLRTNTGAIVPGTCSYSVLPRAPMTFGAPGCSMVYTQSLFNGQLVRFTWTPPATYSCNPTDRTLAGGCWIYVRMQTTGTPPNDLTTWALRYPDEPLRLIK